MPSLPAWLLPVLGSAFALGFYDLCKKHAVDRNSVMHVLFFATLCGSAFYLLATVLWTGSLADAQCSGHDFALIVLKSMLVSSSWTCVYYAMRDLPISIAAPIRASSPLWTFLGGLLLFHEVPTLPQGVAMLLIFTGYYLFSVFGKLEGISFWRAREVHLILLGLGVLELSMSPNALAEVRGVIRKTSMLASEQLAKIALTASDPEDVMVLAKEHIQAVAPDIASILG